MDPRPDPNPLETFLVERYWPGIDLAQLRDALPRLEAAARAMTAEGTQVEHVGSILMPVDQVVFSLIAAGDESLVRQLNERADLPADRIAAAIALLAAGTLSDPPDRVEPGPVPVNDPGED
jgi:hypothetical protein